MSLIATITVNPKEIESGLLSATRSGINTKLHKAAQLARTQILKLVETLIKASPEYQALDGGTLQGDFGIKDSRPALDDIVNAAKNSIDVTVVPVRTIGKTLNGGLTIILLRNGMQDFLMLQSGKTQGSKFTLPWLEWLLTQGDRIIIAGYDVNYNLTPSQRQSSRTGIAIMERGGGWRVPPQFSGTENDNWITRALDPNLLKKQLDDIVANAMKRSL